MAKGSGIIVASNPRGCFLEGILSGALYPGTVVQVGTTAPVQGVHTWVVWAKASGAYGLIACLLPDDLQGQLATTVYVTGTRCFMYCPIMGEDMNMLYNDVAGTADDIAIGDLFGVETATGLLIANSSYAKACFTAMEAVTDPAADQLLWTKYNG